MSEWITDRLPTGAEITNEGDVWVYDIDTDEYLIRNFLEIKKGQPWMEIPSPPSYVKPKRWNAVWAEFRGVWMLHDTNSGATICLCTDNMNVGLNEDTDEHRTAAEEIAAIYERIMPW